MLRLLEEGGALPDIEGLMEAENPEVLFMALPCPALHFTASALPLLCPTLTLACPLPCPALPCPALLRAMWQCAHAMQNMPSGSVGSNTKESADLAEGPEKREAIRQCCTKKLDSSCMMLTPLCAMQSTAQKILSVTMTGDRSWCNGAGVSDAGSEAHRPV